MRPALVWHPHYVVPLKPGHRFPMSKFGCLEAALRARGLLDGPPRLREPEEVPLPLLTRVHAAEYVARVVEGRLTPAELRRIGLPGTPDVTRRARLATAGTLLAARLALEQGVACNLAGGSHHAGPEGGAGFCVFNDVAVAAQTLMDEGRVRRVLVVDLDVHQGDGTARIFAGDPRVHTLSVHAQANYPEAKATSSHDIGLPDGTGDAVYLAAVAAGLDRALAGPRPDIVFYNAGVDPVAGDRLGRLALSLAGLRARETLVMTRLRASRLPVVTVTGGGYGDDPAEVAERHAVLHEVLEGLEA